MVLDDGGSLACCLSVLCINSPLSSSNDDDLMMISSSRGSPELSNTSMPIEVSPCRHGEEGLFDSQEDPPRMSHIYH